MRRRNLENVAVGHGFHLVNGARRDAERLAELELNVARPPRVTLALPDAYTVSSFTLWYCTDSASPALMCRILPTYASVCAQIVSCPHGLGTCLIVLRPLMS